MSDDAGAQKLAVMIVSMLAFATIGVIFSCYRICMEDRLRKKQRQLSPNEEEPSFTYNVVNLIQGQTAQGTVSSTAEHSDYQVIFGSTSLNNTTASITASNNEEVVRHRSLTELRIQNERHERWDEVDINDFHSVPPYESKDESLPTYDQAVSTTHGNP